MYVDLEKCAEPHDMDSSSSSSTVVCTIQCKYFFWAFSPQIDKIGKVGTHANTANRMVDFARTAFF